MLSKDMNTIEVRKEFLPDVCASKSDGIIEACGEMSVDMYRIFIMWYVDGMDIDEIAFAMQMGTSEVREQILEGQAGIIVALKEEMGAEEVDWEAIAAHSGAPIVTRALDVFVNRIFPEESTKDIVSKSVQEAIQRTKAQAWPTVGQQIAPKTPWPGTVARTAPHTAPQAVQAQREQRVRRQGFFSGLAAAAAAFFVAFKSSTPVQAATVAALGVIATFSGVMLYNAAPAPEDTGPPAKPPVQAVEPGYLPPPVVTPPVFAPQQTPGLPQTAPATAAAGQEPDVITYEPAEVQLPTYYPPMTPEEVAAYQLQLAYVKAVREGDIKLHDADCKCGHVNPRSATVDNMEPEKGTIQWAVKKEDRITVLYEGTGTDAGDALLKLRQDYGNGIYHIDFTYTVSDGLSVTKSRPIYIDNGTITENQYE